MDPTFGSEYVISQKTNTTRGTKKTPTRKVRLISYGRAKNLCPKSMSRSQNFLNFIPFILRAEGHKTSNRTSKLFQ